MCINVRSLVNSRNFNKFKSLITVLANKPDIIAINETWEKHDLFGEYRNLSGYTYISNPRLKSKGGGVGLYIKDKLVLSLNSDLTIMNEKYFESIFITIQFKNKSIICGTIYRFPQNDKLSFDIFNNYLLQTLNAINKTKHKCFIMGDFTKY